MDVPDVSVRVLYDFEYTTKDGRQIKIRSGERLFLINKTNADWWHVIRNTERRPFYVPATYVQEIKRNREKEKNVESKSNEDLDISKVEPTSLIQVQDEPCGFSMGYRNRSCSLEEKKMYSVKLSSVDRQRLFKGKFKAPPGLVERLEPKNVPEEVDYVNLRKTEDGFTIDEERLDLGIEDIKLTEVSDPALKGKLEILPRNINNVNVECDSIKPKVKSKYIHNYSLVSELYKNNVKKSESSSSLPVIGSIPQTSSLEDLAHEIQLKTYSLGSNNVPSSKGLNDSPLSTIISVHNKKPSISDSSFESSSAIDSSDLSREDCKINDDSQNSPLKRLNYVGSFKTKQERQIWAKQHFNQSDTSSDDINLSIDSKNDLTEEVTIINAENADFGKTEERLLQSVYKEISKDADIDCKPENIVSICVNYEDISPEKSNKDPSFLESSRKTEEHLQQIQQNLGIAQEATIKIDTSINFDGKLKKSFGDVGLSVKSEHFDVHDGLKDKHLCLKTFGINKNRTSSLKDSTESIKDANSTNSERGSNDSLLELDRNFNNKLSCGATTSDSLVATDGEDLDDKNSESETDSVILTKLKLNKLQEGNKKKIPLTRNRRVESHKARFVPQPSPPSPAPTETPFRTILGEWNEYLTADGRVFYYNTKTKEKRWKPPRHRQNSNEEKHEGNLTNVYSGSSSPLAEVDEKLFPVKIENLSMPAGWKVKADEETGLPCYVNLVTGAKWFSSSDYEGRVYYFEENSNESSWTLPDNSLYSNINDKSEALSKEKEIVKNSNRSGKTKSMIVDKNEDLSVHHVIPRNWPHLFDGHMCVLREGTLYRTKITDNGKRFRKNWASSYVVLTELFLLFFKDLKAFTAMKNGGQPEISRPEINVDLNGAVIDRGDKISSRKNVYMISTVLGLQVLVQFDGQSQTEQWLESIQSAIQKLPSGIDRCLRILKDTKENSKQEDLSADDPKKISRIGRSKSVKLKNKEGSIEDLSVTSAERQTKIRARLKKFFHRRPTMEALVKKGIWKDEPAFGCYLDQVCGKEHPRVPIFVQRCIQCIESTEENMKTDGLYRASGNLSQVQKIRLQVDQNNLDILDQEEDVHVLTGALKLFFRELKQPLIPFHLFNKAIKASTHHNKKEKLSQFRDIVKNLPTPNHDTLKYLLQHLLRVTKYKEFNRMHIPNLAIVFGPTLMWPEQESVNMALDLMQQNLVIESFLVEFEHIFR